MTNYSGEELWNIGASLLHSPDYSRRYSQYLADIIQDENAKILDTACGSGFPSIELHQIGFKNITGFDGNAEALELFKGKLNQIPLIQGDWRNITEIIKDQFDILLNVDNSLPYMDSWQRENPMADNENDISERTTTIIRNFYQLTKPGGKIIMAIAKNNDKSSGLATQFDLGSGEYEGHKVSAIWKLTYDWEHRIKTFDNEVTIDGEVYHMIGKSYLITKEQMADILLKSGFARAEIIETKDLYDNLIIGYK
jgi:SAM-dependent methyltransferase